jgi:O-antigen ligase
VLKFDRDYFNLLNELQSWISTRRLFDKRISGMTYEPSWFAEQLTFTLMPLLFASVLSNHSIFRWRYRKLTIEMILLGWSGVALLFTFSRTGLAVFTGLLVVTLTLGLGRGLRDRKTPWLQVLKVGLQILIILILLILVVFAVGQRNQYFSRLWGYWTDEESEGTFFYYIAFDQRFVYWETAYRVFEDHPAVGVGLGNFTFYFQDYLPDRQYKNPELLMKLVPEVGRNQVVTVKNFLVRLLAETGLLGTAAFIAFLVAVTGCVIYLLLSSEQASRFWGRAGLLELIAFLPVTLSIDSFALPNMWVVFGLITASASVYHRIGSIGKVGLAQVSGEKDIQD